MKNLEINKKRITSIIVIILVGLIAGLFLEKFFRDNILSNLILNERIVKYLAKIIFKSIFLIISILLIYRFKLAGFNGLKPFIYPINLQSTLIVAAIIAMAIFSKIDLYLSVSFFQLVLFAISTILVGFFEEFFFRGLIFPLLIKIFYKNKKVLLISALISSLLFALMHYGRIFRPNENIDEVNSIVIFAFCMGFFLVGIFLRTKNIIIPAIIHGLINFSFGTTSLKDISNVETITSNSTDLGAIILNFGILFFILLSGVYMINKSSKDEVLESLVK